MKKDEQRSRPFEVGDIVRLKSGGGVMVVSELMCASMVRCTYWVRRQMHHDYENPHVAGFTIDEKCLEEAEGGPSFGDGLDNDLLEVPF
jgi:uncharacterized protein YodC (DUF2158 family)